MQQGEIWWVSLDPSAAREQQGHRPVLIVSATAFNGLTGCPVVVPVTSGGNFGRVRGFAVELTGTKTQGVVRCDQPRILDLKSRKGRRAERVPAAVLTDVLNRVRPIFS